MNMKRKIQSASQHQPTTKTVKKNDNSAESTDALYWPFNHPAVLGRGGFGMVQLWYHHSKGSLFAGKSFKREEEYTMELDLVKKLSHDNVIKYVHSYDDKFTIIYDICSTSLHELISNHSENTMGLCQSLILKLIKDASAALNYLIYTLRIVHRDIKPANILYNEHSERFILADFGLAIRFDPGTLMYEDVLCGTPEFIRPDILQSASTNDKIKIPICTELWSLALTIFFAATGKHPFQTKLRQKWIDVARNKPDGCIRITLDGKYAYTIDQYCRLSFPFKTDVFEPLLVFMMSKEPTFEDFFSRIDKILKKQVIRVFEINSYMMESYDKKTFINFTQDKQAKHCIVHKRSFLTGNNVNLSECTENDPILIYDDSKPNVDIQKELNHRVFKAINSFFSDTSVKFDPKQSRCVFSNALNAIHTLSKQSDFLLQITDLFAKKINKNSDTLKVYADCFENETRRFFRLDVPSRDFELFVDNLLQRINSCLETKGVENFEKLDLYKQPDLVTFQETMFLLEHNKLSPSRQEHLQQVIKSMNLCIESCIAEIVDYVKRFDVWIKNIRQRISSLESLIKETQFALQELNNKLVEEIISISK